MKLQSMKGRFGQGMTEYIIIVALIAVAAIGAFTYFGQTVRSQVGGISKELSGQSASTSIQSAQTAAGQAETQGQTSKGLGNYSNTTGGGGGGR